MATASFSIIKGIDYSIWKHKKYEVFFKRYHVMHYPWKENDESIPLLSGFDQVPLQNQVINVTKLCHYTHNEEAEGIDRGDYFLFKPKPKYGKDILTSKRETAVICNPTDEAPNGSTEYRIVSDEEKLLPGCYVWWFIDNSCLPTVTEQDRSIYQYSNRYTASDPFIEPYQSRYGNKKISADLKQLLDCYSQTVRGGTIQYRCGGTLRYNKQILKVVIICSSNHHRELQDYPILPWSGSKSLSSIFSSIQVTIKNGVVRTSNSRSGYSCDTYAFIFHFPNESYELRCPKPRPILGRTPRAQQPISHFDITEIKHNVSNSDVPCCMKIKNPINGDFVCPNDLPAAAKERKRHGGPPDDEDQTATKRALFTSF